MTIHLYDGRSDVNTSPRTISSSAREASELIHRMSPAEQRDLRMKLSALLSDAPNQSSSSPEHDDVDWLLCGIEAELRARGLIDKKSRLRADIICPKYSMLSRPAMSTLRTALRSNSRASALAALGRLTAECLADHLERMRVPVTPRTMLQHAGDAAAAVDAAFPGYIASGMLEKCLRAR